MKCCKTIAEYAIKKWMEDNGFAMNEFSVSMDENGATITDGHGDSMKARYNRRTKKVEVVE